MLGSQLVACLITHTHQHICQKTESHKHGLHQRDRWLCTHLHALVEASFQTHCRKNGLCTWSLSPQQGAVWTDCCATLHGWHWLEFGQLFPNLYLHSAACLHGGPVACAHKEVLVDVFSTLSAHVSETEGLHNFFNVTTV